MKKLTTLLLALVLVLTGCNNKDSIWNVMDDIDSRVSRLEALCQEMNTNIEALETLIKAQGDGDYITNITEIRNGSTVIGYTITFKTHEPITVYNGTNGKDGKDGTNGYTPVIGAKQDTDGIYYWTVDGNWLTDANGNKLRVSGEKGDKGDKGNQGINGNTPQLKIDAGDWYLSYDGTNWSKLGKATGDKGSTGEKGDKGDKGDAGDTMFRSVTQDANYVYFTLADGTLIKIAKNGSTSGGTHADTDIIEFRDLNVKAALLQYTPAIDTNGDGEISYAEAKAVKELGTIGNTFRTKGGDNAEDIVSFKEFQYFTGIKDFCFSSCSKLVEITLPEGINKIPDHALSATAIHSITIPQGCDSIGQCAFQNCSNLCFISIPPSVRYIDIDAFYDCRKITSFTFPENLNNVILLNYSDQLKTIYWNTKRFSADYKAYWYSHGDCYGVASLMSTTGGGFNRSIEQIFFGEKVEIIPAYLCYKLYGIKKVVIPDNVKTIKRYAFQDCTNLDTVVIGNGCETIENNAFTGCRSIKQVTIGDGCITIGSYAFNNTNNATVYIGSGITEIQSYAFGYSCKIYCKATTPPLLGSNAFATTPIIYVPRASVDEYRAIWSDYASRIIGYDFE